MNNLGGAWLDVLRRQKKLVSVVDSSVVPEDISANIRLVRPIAIFLMVLVHVSPGYLSYPGTETSEMGWVFYVRVLFSGILGKVSVPLLSVVSGYLAVKILSRIDFKTYIVSRFRTLYIPLIFWNFIGLLAGVIAAKFLGVTTTSFESVEGQSVFRTIGSSIFALDNVGYTDSLNFLRDLLVVSFLTPLLWGLAKSRAGSTAVVVFLTLAAFDSFIEPFLYRFSILSFFYIGVYLCVNPKKIGSLEKQWGPVSIAAIGFGSLFFLQEVGIWSSADYTVLGARWLDVVTRVLISWVLWLGCSFLRDRSFAFPSAVSASAYLVFLSHLFVFGLVWIPWRAFVGEDLRSPIYFAFYFGAPVLVFVGVVIGNRLIDYLPGAVQIMLRGKARAVRNF